MSEFVDMTISDLRYHVLPAKRLAGSSFAQLHDNVFNFFVRRWTEAFSEIEDQGTPASGWEDHFLKQDIVTAITYKGEVVAAHLYTVYDLSAASTKKSEYFSFFSSEAMKAWEGMGVRNVTSMEYLCVDAKFKKNQLGLSLGKIILGLGAYMTEEKGLDAAIGTPLVGNKVDLMMENVGGHLLEKDINKYGFAVDLWSIPTKPCLKNKDPKYDVSMKHLWNHREDFTKEYFNKLVA